MPVKGQKQKNACEALTTDEARPRAEESVQPESNARWREVSRLFNRAVEMVPGDREKWLNEECAGDAELRREVESLLKSDGRTEALTKIDEGVRGAILSWSADSEKQPGQSISHYDVIEKLGEGGMGMIYKARDRKLNRLAALKLLPHYLSSNPDMKQRFIQEARAAASLDHANICTIYEVGELNGQLYIAMPYYEGETLKEKIEKGALPVSEAIEYAVQITEGLAHAHEAGIVHRDIKPANIIVTARGGLKILDFGIAKVPDASLTQSGVLLGTVAYMSPQQARGGVVDHRTDLWSLGVVLYEMLTGRQPFTGDSSYALLHAIQYEAPLSVKSLRPQIPEGVDRLVRRLMQKEPGRRYADANCLLASLRSVKNGNALKKAASARSGERTRMMRGATRKGDFVEPTIVSDSEVMSGREAKTSTPSRKRPSRKATSTLAVLPLANAGNDPDMEYLSDGITENIINRLSQIPALRVMAWSTVARYKGREATPGEVGRDLGVRAVMMGRVLQLGEKLVVKIELIDTGNGSQLWGEQYDRHRSDILVVQEEVAQEVSEKLRLKLSHSEQKRLIRRPTRSTEAYYLYLKGRYSWYKRTEEGMRKGIDFFNQAIEEDPSYAAAYAGLSDSYTMLALRQLITPKEAFLKAKAAARKALEIDDALGEAYASLAHIRLHDWDWSGLDWEFRRAIELNPGHSFSYHWYAEYLFSVARIDDAVAVMKRAREIDPLSPVISTALAMAFYYARQYDEAIKQFREGLEVNSNYFMLHLRLGETYLQKGMFEEAISEMQKAITLSGRSTETLAGLAQSYAAAGRREEMQKVIDELKASSNERYVCPHHVAQIYAIAGDKEQAFECLEQACREHHPELIDLKVEPAFDPLRSDPRYADLLQRVGLIT
jgi:serine/threonine protein kinase/tetratricopeptide (TPR) repeat protein